MIPLALKGISHFKVAAILGYEFGIGVRSGCFCAHPYILHLLGLSPEEAHEVRARMLAKDKIGHARPDPGLLRAVQLVRRCGWADRGAGPDRTGGYQGVYTQEVATGEYHAAGWQPDFEPYFSLKVG